jgi:glycosyltransferase involved in cell wall biosynthesis
MNTESPTTAEIDKASETSGETGNWLKSECSLGLVSVVVPTYNRAKLVVQAIDSLIQQTWAALEVVVVDDGSEDDTLAVLRLLPALAKGRSLVICTQANRGVSAARNHGTRMSRGEFIMYLDSDDTLVPDAIESFVNAIRESGSDYCFANIGGMDAQGRLLPDEGRWYSHPFRTGDLITNMWSVHAACYRREAVNAAGAWNESMPCCEDHDFNLRMKWTRRETHLAKVQGHYRIHDSDQLHQKHNQAQDYSQDLIMLENFTQWLEKRESISADLRNLLVDRYRFIAFRHGSIGDRDMKNRAIRNIGKLLEKSWSPKRLYGLARYVDSSNFYGKLAVLKSALKR